MTGRRSSAQIYGKPLKKMSDRELIAWFQEMYVSMDLADYPECEDWDIAMLAQQELRRRGYKFRPVLSEDVKAWTDNRGTARRG